MYVNLTKMTLFFAASRVAQNVGFIGLGNMGRGMAKNLLDKGHAVVAFDTDSTSLKDTVSLGAKEATSPNVSLYIATNVNFYNFIDRKLRVNVIKL